VAMQKIDVRVWATEGGGVGEEIWGIEEVRGWWGTGGGRWRGHLAPGGWRAVGRAGGGGLPVKEEVGRWRPEGRRMSGM
jgi:hypothetical protein